MNYYVLFSVMVFIEDTEDEGWGFINLVWDEIRDLLGT